MRKTKAKRGAFWQTQMLPFVVVWAISMAIVGVLSRTIPLPFLYGQPGARGLILNVIGTGIVQVFLVERLLKKSMRGWMLYTTLSAFIILLLNRALPELFFSSTFFLRTIFDNYQPLESLVLSVPTSLLQVFWLRQRVSQPWLWPLLTVPLLLAFNAIPFSTDSYLKLVMMLSVGIVQASLMHYFWQHPKDAEKSNIDFSADTQSEETRLNRLQESDHSTPLWDIGDDQALQSEA